MGVILFLVDTSASMNQRTFLGTSYLDVAKGAIDTFMKYRSRDPASRGDRYMLVSFDEGSNAVKSGWKESHATFVSELKNLQAIGLSTFGSALKESFQLLNLHRLHNCIDHYGQGRNPFFLEPSVIIALTDGGKLANPITVENEIVLPMDSQHEGSELTKEPFRWDQRLFTVLLRLPGMGGVNNISTKVEESLSNMCEATGGKCYVAINQKSLVQAMESLTQKLHPGVVINFQKIGEAPSITNAAVNSFKERSNTPVPMDTDNGSHQVGRRSSQEPDKPSPPPDDTDSSWHCTKKMIYVKPNVKTNVPTGFWPIPESFWPDPSLTTLVYIESSGRQPGITHPFGYLKASSSLTHVTLFVMPFNFTTLLPLISELQRHSMRPPQKWRQEFSEYLSSVPSYYAQPLRNSLHLMGAPTTLVPESFEFQLSFSITNYLRKLKKQGKIVSERVVATISQNRTNEANKRTNGIVDLGEGMSIAIGSIQEGPTAQSFRNPFDISRSSLLDQVARMRTNFLFSSSSASPNMVEEVSRHQIPISQMGNYQEHLKKVNPLREVDSGAVRTQLFGNPFKLEKRGPDTDISFADEHMVETLGNKRSSVKHRLRPPSPYPRSLKSSATSSSSLAPSPLPPSTPLPSQSPNHLLNSNRNRTPRQSVAEEEVTQNNDPKLPVTKEVREGKEFGKEGVKSDSMDTEQGRKVKATPTTGPGVNEVKNGMKNSLDKVQRLSRKRERTPSPTSSLPQSKRRATSPNTVTAGASDGLTNSKMGHPVSKPMGSTNHSMKLSGAVRLVKPEISSASKVLNEEIQKQQGQENTRLKTLIFKEVRKPGKNYETLFQHLEGVKGSVEVRRGFIQDIIREATKFKKRPLIQQLEEWAEKLPSFRTSHTLLPGEAKTSLGKAKSGPKR